MGSACCVAAKGKAVINGMEAETLQRNLRQSPTWSFRWDNNRGRVAGEETSVNWSSDGISGTDTLEFKSGTTGGAVYASEEGSPLDSFRSLGNNRNLSLPLSEPMVVRNSTEVKESAGSSALMLPSPLTLSPSVPSVSSLSTSPRFPHHSSARHLTRRYLKSPTFSISEDSSSFMLPGGWSNESTRGGSHGGSSDGGWSGPAFADQAANHHRDRWSFDTSQSFGSPSLDFRTCGICAKLLNDKVVAVLVCGHVFHAECLENMTSEPNQFDPACPVCTFGEKQALKIYEKAIAKIDLKARKRFRNRIIDSDSSGNISRFVRQKSSAHDGRCPQMSPSSSTKNSSKRPFLRRYFSMGSKGSKSYSESLSTRKKGFFWTRFSKE